jgi:hypothetical protein
VAPTGSGAAEDTAAAAGGGGDGDGVLRISESFASIKVLPKVDERGHPNFPRNLHNACELFCATGNVGSAIKVQPQFASPKGETGCRKVVPCVPHCGICIDPGGNPHAWAPSRVGRRLSSALTRTSFCWPRDPTGGLPCPSGSCAILPSHVLMGAKMLVAVTVSHVSSFRARPTRTALRVATPCSRVCPPENGCAGAHAWCGLGSAWPVLRCLGLVWCFALQACHRLLGVWARGAPDQHQDGQDDQRASS